MNKKETKRGLKYLKRQTALINVVVIIIGIIICSVAFCKTNDNEESVTNTSIPNNTEPAIADDSIKDTEIEDDLSQCCYLPEGDINYYTYMDLNTIDNPTSKQYELKQSYWLSDLGIWCHGNDYVVAVGTGYGKVGDRFHIITKTGKSYTIFVGDLKEDWATDETNRYTSVWINGKEKKNVIEFIVDINSLSEKVRTSGDLSDYDLFGGGIMYMEKIK